MNAGEGIVVPGIGFGVGADFGDQAFDVKILGIVGQDAVEIFKIPLVVVGIFGIFVPGDKVKADARLGSGFEERLDPVTVVGGDGRAADFINSITSALGDGPGGIEVERSIRGVFAIMPAAKKIRFVPDFVVDAGDVFLDRITTGGGGNQIGPFGGKGKVGSGVGEGEHRAGAG